MASLAPGPLATLQGRLQLWHVLALGGGQGRGCCAGHPRMILASDVKRTNLRGQRQVRIQRPNSTIAPLVEESHLRSNFSKVRPAAACSAKRHVTAVLFDAHTHWLVCALHVWLPPCMLAIFGLCFIPQHGFMGASMHWPAAGFS